MLLIFEEVKRKSSNTIPSQGEGYIMSRRPWGKTSRVDISVGDLRDSAKDLVWNNAVNTYRDSNKESSVRNPVYEKGNLE